MNGWTPYHCLQRRLSLSVIRKSLYINFDIYLNNNFEGYDKFIPSLLKFGGGMNGALTTQLKVIANQTGKLALIWP